MARFVKCANVHVRSTDILYTLTVYILILYAYGLFFSFDATPYLTALALQHINSTRSKSTTNRCTVVPPPPPSPLIFHLIMTNTLY